jgi:hypothetical protein
MREHYYYLCLNLRYIFSMASLYHNLSGFWDPTSVVQAKSLAVFKFCVNFYIPLATLSVHNYALGQICLSHPWLCSNLDLRTGTFFDLINCGKLHLHVSLLCVISHYRNHCCLITLTRLYCCGWSFAYLLPELVGTLSIFLWTHTQTELGGELGANFSVPTSNS